MNQCHETHTNFTVVVLQSGGLLCTHSAIRSGWTPLWGTEICPTHTNAPIMCQSIEQLKDCNENSQQQMWYHLTGTTCYGNTFANITQYSKLEKPMYLKVSPECTYYCVGGAQTGSNSLTGWQLPDVSLVILEIEPLIVQIENSSNAPNVNSGIDVMTLKQRLSSKYVLHIKDQVSSYDYGDNVHSSRWICIGIHKRMGEFASSYTFPNKLEITQPAYCARDIADPDESVPPSLWRKDNTSRLGQQIEPIPGEVHSIARAGPGMGSSWNPNLVSSWDGATPRPTTYGGAIRHPKLSWVDYGYNPVGPTRLATNNELARSMSAPPDTIDFYAKFDASDEFFKRNIGNAISCMLAEAIDTSVLNHVKAWMLKSIIQIPRSIEYANDHNTIELAVANLCSANSDINILYALSSRDKSMKYEAHDYQSLNPHDATDRTDTFPPIRSALVDTAANKTFLYCSVEQWMKNPRSSNVTIQVADAGTSMKGSKDGKLSMLVVTGANESNRDIILEPKARLEVNATTVKNLHRELISIDEHYVDGKFNILLKQPDFEDGIPQMFKSATDHSPEVMIPFRYDYQNGGFWLDYIPVYSSRAFDANAVHGQTEHNILIHKHLHDMNPTQTGPPAQYMTVPEAIQAAKDMADKAEVTEVFHSRHAEEREIKGVKAGLRKRKNKMTIRDFHEEHNYAHG